MNIINYSSFTYKIKGRNRQNMNFVQKQKHNEYFFQIHLLLFKNVQRQFQKCATSPLQVSFAYLFRNKVCSFLRFYIYLHLKRRLANGALVCCDKRCEYVGVLSSKMVCCDLKGAMMTRM